MATFLSSLYRGVNAATEQHGLYAETNAAAKTSWGDILAQAKRDAGATFRDLPFVKGFYRPSGSADDVAEFISRAVAARNRAKGATIMNNDRLYYMSALVPGGAPLFYWMSLLMNVYAGDERAEPGIVFKRLGIEQPVATVLDDNVEKMFLLYIYACIERDPDRIPLPFPKGGSAKLGKEWRAWIRERLRRFLCSDYGVSVKMLEGTCV